MSDGQPKILSILPRTGTLSTYEDILKNGEHATVVTGGVILIRFPGDARTLLGSTVVEAVSRYGDRLSGSFVVMSPGRIRIAEKP